MSRAISCGATAHCSIGGGSTADGKHYQAIVADETPALSTTTTESRSARSVIYGREQAEKVSVTVVSARGPVPGKVTVTSAGTRACTITLARGKGSCTIPARKFSSGPHALTATYGGAPGFATSSAASLFWVDRAKSKTTLTLSAATASYGHQQAVKLTIRIIPQYTGTPGGKVAVMAGRVRVCLITLKRATGSCRLRARTLRPGTYQMLGAYAGNQDFKASASPAQSLTITR